METTLPGMDWEVMPFPGKTLQSVVDEMEEKPSSLALKESICCINDVRTPGLPEGTG